jgi:hypothetical protein
VARLRRQRICPRFAGKQSLERRPTLTLFAIIFTIIAIILVSLFNLGVQPPL